MEMLAKVSAALVVGSCAYKMIQGANRSDNTLQQRILEEQKNTQLVLTKPAAMSRSNTENLNCETTIARATEEATLKPPREMTRYRTDSFAEVSGADKDKENLWIFVLTGGPCAGKTTAMARVSTYFRTRGFTVYTVPEAATIMMSNGATFADLDSDEKELTFQACLLTTQMNLEDLFVRMSSTTNKPCILLCDRGTMDGRAYIPPTTWDKMMQRNGYDYINLRDRRYNAVFHLVTAANGAEKYYTLENNAVRLETAEEAKAVDLKLQEAWIGHSNLVVFDNSTSFEDKMQRLIATTSQLVGLHTAAKKKFVKYLMSGIPETALPVKSERFEVEKVYLHMENMDNKNEYCFQRKRAQGSLCSYGLTTVTKKDGVKIETKRIIRGREYASNFASLADHTRKIVRQQRICFLWAGLYYEIYHYINEDITVLNCQVEGEDKKVEIPPFLDVVRDVTNDPEFSAYYLSLKDRPPTPLKETYLSPSPTRTQH